MLNSSVFNVLYNFLVPFYIYLRKVQIFHDSVCLRLKHNWSIFTRLRLFGLCCMWCLIRTDLFHLHFPFLNLLLVVLPCLLIWCSFNRFVFICFDKRKRTGTRIVCDTITSFVPYRTRQWQWNDLLLCSFIFVQQCKSSGLCLCLSLITCGLE